MAQSGGTVAYSTAVQEIKDYLLVHDKLKDLLDDYLPSPTPGSNMEKMKQFFQSNKLSFAFKKENIDELFNTYPNANAIRIYLGLNSDNPSVPEPTIVITACAVTQNAGGDIITATNQTAANAAIAAKQYPKSISPKNGYNQTNFDLAGDTL